MWCTTAQDVLPGSTAVSGTTITRRTSEEGLNALGVWITFDGHFTKEIADREVLTWKRFFPLRHLLCNNKVALSKNTDCLCLSHLSSVYRVFRLNKTLPLVAKIIIIITIFTFFPRNCRVLGAQEEKKEEGVLELHSDGGSDGSAQGCDMSG